MRAARRSSSFCFTWVAHPSESPEAEGIFPHGVPGGFFSGEVTASTPIGDSPINFGVHADRFRRGADRLWGSSDGFRRLGKGLSRGCTVSGRDAEALRRGVKLF